MYSALTRLPTVELAEWAKLFNRKCAFKKFICSILTSFAHLCIQQNLNETIDVNKQNDRSVWPTKQDILAVDPNNERSLCVSLSQSDFIQSQLPGNMEFLTMVVKHSSRSIRVTVYVSTTYVPSDEYWYDSSEFLTIRSWLMLFFFPVSPFEMFALPMFVCSCHGVVCL